MNSRRQNKNKAEEIWIEHEEPEFVYAVAEFEDLASAYRMRDSKSLHVG